MAGLMRKVGMVVLLVIFGMLLRGGCAPHFAHAFAQESVGTNGDTSTLCAELESWFERVTEIYHQLLAKHSAANAATEDCSTYEARERVRSLFSQAAALFKDLLNEVETLANRYPATLGLADTIADAVQQTAAMYADYQTGVQYMIDMTYAHAEENTSQAMALAETGAGYCNQAMTVDDILVATYETIRTAVCQEPYEPGPPGYNVPGGKETGQGIEFEIPFLPEFSSFVLGEVTDCETGDMIDASVLSTEFIFSAAAQPPYQLADLEKVIVYSPGYSPHEITQFQSLSISLLFIRITLLMPAEPDICLEPIGTIELISPEDGEEIDTPTPTFEWMPVVTVVTFTNDTEFLLTIWQLTEDLAEKVAAGYRLSDEDYDDLEPYFVAEGIEENSFVYPEDTDYPLVPGFSYAWQVQAVDVGGNLVGKSEVWSFVTLPAEEPVTIELISPEDGEEIDTPTPTFEWMPIVTLINDMEFLLTIWQLPDDLAERVEEGYRLSEEDFVDREPYFVAEGIEGNSFFYPEDTDYPLVPGFTYAWQVQAFDVAGNLTGKSGIYQVSFAPKVRDTLPWSAGRPLTWDDFKGKPPENWETREEAAFIYSGIGYSFQWRGWFCRETKKWKAKLTVATTDNTMDRSKSWVGPNKKTDALLNHEQKHFDLNEVYRRLLDAALQKMVCKLEVTGNTAEEAEQNLRKKLAEVFNKYNRKLDELQKQYDRETDHGRNAEKQAEWDKKIATWLANPSQAPAP